MGSDDLTPTGPRTARRSRPLLPRAATFFLLVTLLIVMLAATIAPTPLYSTYQAEWGFSPVTLTAVFASYALTVLAALLTIGGLSDHVGRRPMLFAGVVLQAVAIVIFLVAGNVAALFVARIVQGVAVGAAMGAIGGGLLDLDRIKGTLANAAGGTAGNAVGALLAGLFVAFLPAPTRLIYAALLVTVIGLGLGLIFIPETSSPRPGAWASLRPQLAVPSYARGPFLAAVPIFVATTAILGFYASLGPAVAREVSGSDSAVFGGLTLFILSGAASIAILVTRNVTPIRLQVGGSVALMLGVGVTEASLSAPSLSLLLVGSGVAGAGFGPAVQGALRTILPLAGTHDRAGIVSAFFILTYLALGVPAVIAGVLVTRGDLLTTTRGFGAVVILLAGVPVVTAAARRLRRTRVAGPLTEDDPGC